MPPFYQGLVLHDRSAVGAAFDGIALMVPVVLGPGTGRRFERATTSKRLDGRR
jgi:hypothetical protein